MEEQAKHTCLHSYHHQTAMTTVTSHPGNPCEFSFPFPLLLYFPSKQLPRDQYQVINEFKVLLQQRSKIFVTRFFGHQGNFQTLNCTKSIIQTNMTKLYSQKGCLKVRKTRPPSLKQQLLEPKNLVQRLSSLDAISSSWQNQKARKSSQNAH